MPWKKGESGNPSGRPKRPHEKRTVTQLAREMSADALKTLRMVMMSPKATMTARAIAADKILDRAWGKAPQLSLVDINGGHALRRARDLSDDELKAICAAALPAIEGPGVIEGEVVERGADVEGEAEQG